ATWENPAGLAAARKRRLTLGYVYGMWRLDINDVGDNVDDTNATVVGAELPLPGGGPLANRLVLGLGFLAPIGVVDRARVPSADRPSLILLEDRAQVVGVEVAAALRISPLLDVGASVLTLAALTGHVNIHADSEGRISSRSDQQLVADYTPIL